MNRMFAARVAGAVLLSVAVCTAGSLSANAQPAATTSEASSLSPNVLAALQRDLGLTASKALGQLAAQQRAASTEKNLRAKLGGAFGGAWFDPAAGTLVAGVTDPSTVAAVEAAGATARVVEHSEGALEAMKTALDQHATAAPEALTGWYVDAKSNSLAVQVNRTAPDAAEAAGYVAAVVGDVAAVKVAAVKVVEVAAAPQPLESVYGGDAWYGPNFRCSVGFSATDGGGGKHFVTAGHCTAGGGSAYGYDQVYLGYSNGSSFPGHDYGKVDVTSSQWSLTPYVLDYSGGVITVTGSAEAPVGGSVCRSGSTTGLHCGTIQAKNQTVRYSQGTVYGLTQTDVCAEPGDSGGSWISGSQAQGVTSGGSGNCSSGGTTFFQPINPALSAFGLHLVTG